MEEKVLNIAFNPRVVRAGVVCWLFLVSSVVYGQQPHNTGGYWLTYLGDNKVNDKIGVHTEGQLRNIAISNGQATKFLRVGVNLYTSKTAILSGGYGFFYTEPSRENVSGHIIREHRGWEQFLMRKKTNYVFMEHRYRLEQRFIQHSVSDQTQLDHRIRYRFQAILPFYTLSPYLRHFFFAHYNEVMLNFRKNSAEIYDRNRFYVALGVQVSPKLNFQFGYLNQLANQGAYPNLEVNHLLQIGVSYNMDDLMRSFFMPIKPNE